ncbi:MAG: bifunctional DNA-formamidopyrimidine glycosylase/DNA-(apurinic or apyrimidinic site) lyase [Candidatus Aminicenantales bacterium]
MPELPEVETIVRSLRPYLVGQKIKFVRLIHRPLLRNSQPSELRKFRGGRVWCLRRRGKMILLDIEKGLSLLFHLKMTGCLLMSSQKSVPYKHTRLMISFEDGKELRFVDPRKFGFVRSLKTEGEEDVAELRKLGPEPLNLEFETFARMIRQRRGRLKSLLVNQSFLAGIGNIYADEICFEAKLHPTLDVSQLRPGQVRRLWEAIRFILKRAIVARGTSLRNYRDGVGQAGGFQHFLRVYGREGEACFRCRAKIVRLRLAGRSTHFCPRCQRQTA